MAVTAKKLYGGTLTTSAGAVLYTVPAATTTVVTNITICNKTTAAVSVTLTLDGAALFTAAPVAAHETWLIGPAELRQALPAAATVTGSAGAGSALDIRITGAEITA
jgi:hypothetical protein